MDLALPFVGACSVVSLAGDPIKATVLSRAELITEPMWWTVAVAIPLMPLATWIGEHGFRGLFGFVMVVFLRLKTRRGPKKASSLSPPPC